MESESPFTKKILAGTVALITGGSSGIGYEVARQFGLHGAQLVLMGRRLAVLQRAAEALSNENIQVKEFDLGDLVLKGYIGVYVLESSCGTLHTVIMGWQQGDARVVVDACGETRSEDVEIAQGEVRSSNDAINAVDVAVSTFGRLDILVNGAAGNFLAPAETLTPKGFKTETVLEIDTVGTFNMCHAGFSALRRGGRGRQPGSTEGGIIINISATLHYGATWYQSHASAAKAAVDSLTRSLCLEWGPEYGIRINGIAPGPISNTAGMTKLGASGLDFVNEIPLGRPGTTWDIAMAALFLASNAGSWISGETLVVDGGHWLGKPQLISRDAVVQFSRSVEKKSRDVGIPAKSTSKL